MIKPIFSIITASYNRADFIETAIQSVLDQKYEDLEHIIIDGGSTDGTLELLKKYPRLRVYSEPDNGVYDAFNKGISLARGDVLTFLNSDDRWGSGFLDEVKARFIKDPSLEVVTTGAGIYERNEEGVWRQTRYLAALPGGEYFFKNLKRRGPAVNAWFIHRKLIDRIGQFNSAFQISADQEFCIRAILKNAVVQSLDVEAYHYLAHPDSLTIHDDPEKRTTAILENIQIIEGFLKGKCLKQYQVKYFRNWYRNLSIRELKRGIRLVQPKRILTSVMRIIRSQHL